MLNKITLKLLDTQAANDGEAIVYSSASDSVAFSTISGGGSGLTVYELVSSLPTSGNSGGDLAYVSSTNKLYYWANKWKNIPLTTVL